MYETRCIVSGKIYVGVHRQGGDGFDGYLGSGTALDCAIKKYGVENFERRTLGEFSTEAEAYARETEIVTEEFCKRRDTYNMKPGGAGGGLLRHSAETREKMSQAHLGRTFSAEAREKLRQANLGKTVSAETREKLRQASLGRTHSDETREKMRRANLGKTVSAETREKLRQASLGKTHSAETREKLRHSSLGRTHSDETREKMRQAQRRRRRAERRRHAA